MSWVGKPPYGERDQDALLASLNELTRRHLAGCPEYGRIWNGWSEATRVAEIPYVHVGIFKHLQLRTAAPGIHHERVLLSSATTSGLPSQVVLDRESSELQAKSAVSILRDFVGAEARPLLVLDSARSLRSRNISARTAAAMSLRPLSTDIHFLLADADDSSSVRWDVLGQVLEAHDELLVYGFTWVLWKAWASVAKPAEIEGLLRDKSIHFVHSGGWKKLDDLKIRMEDLNAALLRDLAPDSKVVDYYGLAEQVGIIYPLCEHGSRHVPVWADVLVRDPYSSATLETGEGQLQLLNVLSLGAPYHSVLTEDLGRLVEGPCPCGRRGTQFQLIGRVPKAQLRGCANV